jgi:hypothetical protein
VCVLLPYEVKKRARDTYTRAYKPQALNSEVPDRAKDELTMLSYILKSKTYTVYKMKIPSLKKKDNVAKGNTKFVCKECKMVFSTKESLELHKKKSRHFTGLVYFGKHEK